MTAAELAAWTVLPEAVKPVSTGFESFIGIDWSGAAQPGYGGIAVARCAPGRLAPVLVRPARGKVWSRTAVLDWLLAELQRLPRLLVGFDFAFALPGDGRPLHALWAAVEARCASEPDLLGRLYVAEDPRFWHRGTRPVDWIEQPRAAERACTAAGFGTPQTPFQLIGAKQVGKGSLAGMRLLHRLREQALDRLAIWPLDADGPRTDPRSFCVEIYPRLFIRRAGLGNRKLRALDDINHALNQLDSIGIADGVFDDHQADALVSAAGLRRLAGDDAIWRAGAGQAEGWIFGVP